MLTATQVVGHDAVKYWSTFERGMYDYVLLDAPCSSDRHVLQQALKRDGAISQSEWSVARCKDIGQLQTKVSEISAFSGGWKVLDQQRLMACTIHQQFHGLQCTIIW